MIDILLLCPRPDRPFHHKYIPLSPPLGLGYIGKALDMCNITFKLYDMYNTPLNRYDIVNLVEELKPKIIGFMVYTESVSTTITICNIVKKINKEIITVAGGPHPTFKTEEILENPNLDIAIVHEGEETFIDIWEEVNKEVKDFSKIKGIAYKDSNKIIKTQSRPPIQNLDKYGFPNRDWYPHLERYLEPSTIISSRGCPGRCSFCGGANISGGVYRKRSVDSIREETLYLRKKFPNDSIIFWDDAFGFDVKRLKEICNMFILTKQKGWSCGIRVDRVTKELLRLMGEAGCIKINFGVESGSQIILDEAMKGISIEQIKQAVKWAEEANIYNSCSLIIGHPNDTHETVQETLCFAEQLLNGGATSCTFNAMVPFPGTFVYENKEKLGIKFKTEKWEDFHFLNPVFETKGLNLEELRKYLIDGLLLWGRYKNNRDKIQGRLRKRDAILLGDFLGRNVQT